MYKRQVYLGVLLALMYVPILLVIVYSFNESKTSAVWAGFSWKWYEQLFRDEDLFEALKNSIVLGVLSSCAAAVDVYKRQTPDGTLSALPSP